MELEHPEIVFQFHLFILLWSCLRVKQQLQVWLWLLT
jgi:hypothetical protein